MRRFVASGSAALIAVAMLTACGGGGSSKAESPGATSSATNPSGDSGDSADSKLKQLIDEASKEKYKVTYTTGDGGDEQTYAQDGEGNSAGGDDNSLLFVSSGSTIACNKSGETWECQQSPVSIGTISPFLGALTAQNSYLNALGDRFGDTSDKTIAGRDATCITISSDSILGDLGSAIADKITDKFKGSATYCFDKETGVTLEISGTDEDGKASNSIVVTKFEIPTAADFQPPAEVKAAPSIPDFTIPSSITIPGGGEITIPSIPGQ